MATANSTSTNKADRIESWLINDALTPMSLATTSFGDLEAIFKAIVEFAEGPKQQIALISDLAKVGLSIADKAGVLVDVARDRLEIDHVRAIMALVQEDDHAQARPIARAARSRCSTSEQPSPVRGKINSRKQAMIGAC